MNTVATTILEQLGSDHFIAMTGAKDFVGSADALRFRVTGRYNGRAVNRVEVLLRGDDTYRITVSYLRGIKRTIVGMRHDVYADNLRPVFERLTGLYTSLGRVG